MFDKFYVGRDILSFENNGTFKPISRVTLLIDDENELTAGDDTGMELTASCPFATQEMVNSILERVKGYEYKAFSADGVNINPAAELGDGITVNGIYSVISTISDHGDGYPDISAPGESELEDEYPTAGPMSQEFNRKIAETNSKITKTAEQIRLEVENELEGLSSSFTASLDSIKSEVSGLSGQVSTIEQYVDSLTLSVSNGSTSSTITLKSGDVTIASQNITMSGLVTLTSLYNGTTTIDGGCIKAGSTIEAPVISGGTVVGSVVAGGQFSDLQQSSWLEMGTPTSMIAYLHHYASLYSDTEPVCVMGYYGNPGFRDSWVLAPFYSIILEHSKTLGKTVVYGEWDFSYATVTGLPASSTSSEGES